jgi:hypothetical protein
MVSTVGGSCAPDQLLSRGSKKRVEWRVCAVGLCAKC